MERIEVIQGDITTQVVDVIVNAANGALCGGGGVDGAIHRAAGPRLLEECLTLGRCPTGEARITRGYDLPAEYVIHAVGPVWYGGHRDEEALLASCYQTSLQIAEEHQLRSIAFPCISCGAYRFPIERAAHITIETICDHLAHSQQLQRVLIVCFEPRTFQAFQDALEARRYAN